MEKHTVRAAFATDDKHSVNAEFVKARHLVIYEVSGEAATLERTLDFAGGEGGGMKSPRVTGLAGCAVVFVAKPVSGDEALGLIRSKIFVTKLQTQEAIDSVLERLQNTLRRGVYPLWLRKAISGAPVEPTQQPASAAMERA